MNRVLLTVALLLFVTTPCLAEQKDLPACDNDAVLNKLANTIRNNVHNNNGIYITIHGFAYVERMSLDKLHAWQHSGGLSQTIDDSLLKEALQKGKWCSALVSYSFSGYPNNSIYTQYIIERHIVLGVDVGGFDVGIVPLNIR